MPSTHINLCLAWSSALIVTWLNRQLDHPCPQVGRPIPCKFAGPHLSLNLGKHRISRVPSHCIANVAAILSREKTNRWRARMLFDETHHKPRQTHDFRYFGRSCCEFRVGQVQVIETIRKFIWPFQKSTWEEMILRRVFVKYIIPNKESKRLYFKHKWTYT